MQNPRVALFVGLMSIAVIFLLVSCGDGGSDRQSLLRTYYTDVDGDGFGDPAHAEDFSSPQDGWVLDNTDCDDANADIHPAASEICNDGFDNNCDGLVDCYDEEVCVADEQCSACTDVDSDTYLAINDLCSGGDDCDDTDTAINPGGTGAFGCPAACSNCTEDEDCGTSNRCLMLDGANICANACVDFDLCPDGYACQLVDADRLCIPESASCECLPEDAGKERTCLISNEFGTCYGQESCDSTTGWINCTANTPGADVCDGIDNNCDGDIDENFLELGTECYAGIGECRRSGTTECYSETETGCNAVPAQPQEEICDGLDNDCDGVIDDNLIIPACEYQQGVCAGARKNPALCTGETGWLACQSADYASYSTGYEENEVSCDGLDNDCDGMVDEDCPL